MQYEIQGVAIKNIVKEYGTPLYVYDAEVIKNTYLELRSHLPSDLEIFYSLKANPNISIYNLLKSLGTGAEVSSLTELKTALMSNTDPNNIIFLGPGKSIEEITYCIEHSIYAIVCESIQELRLIDQIASKLQKKVRIALRINPSFKVNGSKLVMGGKPRQFGIDEEFLFSNIDLINSFENVEIIGIHVYMGTRILDYNEIYQNTRNILNLANLFVDLLKCSIQFIDIGGGLGVPYYSNESEIDIKALGNKITFLINEFKINYPNTRIVMELGRFLVAKSGVFVSKVRYLKKSRGENFVITDGGTNCHMAAVGIGSYIKRNFPIINLTNLSDLKRGFYNITGPLCTPNDLIGKRVELPSIRVDDLIGVLNSGAYGPSASPGLFLSHGYPAEVVINGGKSYLIRRRDESKDILEKQVLHNLVK